MHVAYCVFCFVTHAVNNAANTPFFRSIRSSDITFNATPYCKQQVQEAEASLVSRLGPPEVFDFNTLALFHTEDIDGTTFKFECSNRCGSPNVSSRTNHYRC